MAAITPPTFLQAGSHPAEGVRRALYSLVGRRGGLVGANDLAVSQRGAGANMSVDVAEGQVMIPGNEVTYQGVYLCDAQGVTNLAIAASDPTNPRRDLVVGRVRDTAYSGVSNTYALEVVTGTPAASPADPAVPANSWVLARVAVAAAASSITNANITDLRTDYTTNGQRGRVAALGGLIICTSTSRPTGVTQGQGIYETDTKKILYTTDSGTTWVETADLDGWTTFTPTITQGVNVTFTTNYCRFQRLAGRTIHYTGYLVVTSTGTGSAVVDISFPIAPVTAMAGAPGGSFYIFDAAPVATNHLGFAVVRNATALSGLKDLAGGYMGTTGFTGPLATGDSVLWDITYEAAS